MNDQLGNRMKQYEGAYNIRLPKRLPVILRLDGRSFHNYTKGLKRPFSNGIISAMWEVARAVCEDVQGAQVAYVQSDEISVLIHNYKTLNQESWFDNKVQKMCSVSASIAAGVMTMQSQLVFGTFKRACFDARVFILPEAEVNNYMHWRQADWTRNSVQMLARSLYSHKQLHGKNNDELQEMIFQKGQNWNDLPTHLKRGACIIKETYTVPGTDVLRSRWTVDKEIPIFTQDRDYINKFLKPDSSE